MITRTGKIFPPSSAHVGTLGTLEGFKNFAHNLPQAPGPVSPILKPIVQKKEPSILETLLKDKTLGAIEVLLQKNNASDWNEALSRELQQDIRGMTHELLEASSCPETKALVFNPLLKTLFSLQPACMEKLLEEEGFSKQEILSISMDAKEGCAFPLIKDKIAFQKKLLEIALKDSHASLAEDLFLKTEAPGIIETSPLRPIIELLVEALVVTLKEEMNSHNLSGIVSLLTKHVVKEGNTFLDEKERNTSLSNEERVLLIEKLLFNPKIERKVFSYFLQNKEELIAKYEGNAIYQTFLSSLFSNEEKALKHIHHLMNTGKSLLHPLLQGSVVEFLSPYKTKQVFAETIYPALLESLSSKESSVKAVDTLPSKPLSDEDKNHVSGLVDKFLGNYKEKYFGGMLLYPMRAALSAAQPYIGGKISSLLINNIENLHIEMPLFDFVEHQFTDRIKEVPVTDMLKTAIGENAIRPHGELLDRKREHLFSLMSQRVLNQITDGASTIYKKGIEILFGKKGELGTVMLNRIHAALIEPKDGEPFLFGALLDQMLLFA